MEGTTADKFKRLYSELCVISNYNFLVFWATMYSQPEYPDYYLWYVFYASILISGLYIAVIVSRNKGFFRYNIEKAGRKSYRGAALAMLYIFLSAVAFMVHGEVAYVIQNILYAAAFTVLVAGLITVRIKSSRVSAKTGN